MKGLLLPAAMALAAHALILGLDVKGSSRGPQPFPVQDTVTLALTYLSPSRDLPPPLPRKEEPEPGPAEKPVAPPKKEKPSHRPQRRPSKETVVPPKAEEREPAPVPFTPETGPPRETPMATGEPEIEPPSSSAKAVPDATPKRVPLPADTFLREAIPAYKENPAPTYPQAARRRGIQGTVLLEVFVSTLGRVKDLRVLQSSGHDTLDRAALEAVGRWTFQPGKRGEEEIAMWVKVPIRFELK